MPEPQQLLTHLEQVFGEAVELAPAKRTGLPVYLTRAYTLWSGGLVGQRVLFACARGDQDRLTTKRIEADARAFQVSAEDEFVVIVLPRVEAHVRRGLIRRRVPFIVPGRQLFLPTFGIDLQERELGPQRQRPDRFDWASQVTVLRHLLWGDIEEKSLRVVAAALGYSPMTLSNVQRQLVATSIAEVAVRGRAHTIRFPGTTRDTWAAALPHLRTPVRRSSAIRVLTGLPDMLHAGLSALSHLTEIADADIPTMAADRERAAAAERDGQIEWCPDADEADAILEIWNYDPSVLARGKSVDPLSLYLSFRDDPDARTQQATEQLLETFRW